MKGFLHGITSFVIYCTCWRLLVGGGVKNISDFFKPSGIAVSVLCVLEGVNICMNKHQLNLSLLDFV